MLQILDNNDKIVHLCKKKITNSNYKNIFKKKKTKKSQIFNAR